MKRVLSLALLLSLLAPTAILADGGIDEPVARNEALALKNTVRAVLAGLGAPPAGYAQSKDEFDLPTGMGSDKDAGRYWLRETSATFEFTSGMSGEQMSQEYQKEIAAAQAKGDYQKMQTLATDLQQKMMSAMNTEMTKIEVKVWLNRNVHQAIDPEGVLWETPGAMALKLESSDPNKARLLLAFDPKALADTQTLSLINNGESFNASAAQKTAVRSISVELTGPGDAITAWAQGVDKKSILALVRE